MSGGLISVDAAMDILTEHRVVTPVVRAALGEAVGLVLAEPVVARVSQPPLTVSAMDGYAVRLGDVAQAGAVLHVIGEAPAGTPFGGRVGAGEAVRIFTGGALPDGADHVVIQEDTVRVGASVTVTQAHSSARHVRPAGMDFRKGEVLIEAGTRLSPAHVSAAAAANHAELAVHRRPRVALLANGDELRAPGSELQPGQIVNSSPVGLAALIRDWGAEVDDLGIGADSPDAIRAFVRRADEADIIVPIGGASVGDHDHMRAAFAGLGLKEVFAKVAVRPGKPTWFGRMGAQRVLGLPGNPASAWVCAHLFLRPLLSWDQGAHLTGRVSSGLEANGAREAFLRARAAFDDEARLVVTPMPHQDSSLIRPFIDANVLIRRRAHARALNPEDRVDLVPIGQL